MTLEEAKKEMERIEKSCSVYKTCKDGSFQACLHYNAYYEYERFCKAKEQELVENKILKDPESELI